MTLGELNFLAIIVATIAAMGVGAFWYSPIAFANQWMALIGKKPEELGNPAQAMGMQLVNTFVTAVFLGVVVAWSGVSTPIGGAGVGLVAWIGFVLTAHLATVFFEGRPIKLVMIDTGGQLVCYMAMGAILGAWQ